MSSILLFCFNAIASDFPTKGDQAVYEFVTATGAHQTWTFVVTDSDLRLYSARVLLEEAGAADSDVLLGSTPFYTRLMNSANSDQLCDAERMHHGSNTTTQRELILAANQSIMTCHVHTNINGVSYDVWYGNVPFNKVKFKIAGGRLPGRYLVEPGEGILKDFRYRSNY